MEPRLGTTALDLELVIAMVKWDDIQGVPEVAHHADFMKIHIKHKKNVTLSCIVSFSSIPN